MPLEDVRRFEREFIEFLGRDHAEILDSIENTKDLSGDTVTLLEKAIAEFKGEFVTASGQPLVKDEPIAPLEDEDRQQLEIRRPSAEQLKKAVGSAGDAQAPTGGI